jgi:tail assembly chaperone E/41/14-like protein
MSDVVTYALKSPLQDQNGPITEVTVRQPIMRDLLVLDQVQGEAALVAKMIHLLTGLHPSRVEELALRDIRALGGIVRPSFVELREGGGT